MKLANEIGVSIWNLRQARTAAFLINTVAIVSKSKMGFEIGGKIW